jgi:hypothetical protein
MLLINHKVNTIEKLQATPVQCGVEIDIRAYADRLVLHHDPFVEGCDFEEWLQQYNHAFVIFNIKCEGIEEEVIRLAEKYGILNYFLLDVTPPFMFKLINKGVHKLACRFSEFESIETCLNLIGKVKWVFIDNLTHLPVQGRAFEKLREHFKLCIVSPELLQRDEVAMTKQLLIDNPVDAVLTDNVGGWQ